MSSSGLQPVLPPTRKHPRTEEGRTPSWRFLVQFLGVQFSIVTWILVGACVQSVLYLAFHTHFKYQAYVAIAAFGLLGARIINCVLMASGLKPNAYMENVQLGRRAAFVPDSNGMIPDSASQQLIVFILGAKTNHPFGVFNAKFREMGSHLAKMDNMFQDAESPPEGFMGQTNWYRNDERGATELIYLSYWRSFEELHAFAHGPTHRAAWDWWNKSIKDLDAVGIMHEVYEAPPGAWENIYVNFQPTMFGATSVMRQSNGEFVQGEIKNPGEWITPLVDARRGRFGKATQRMGRDQTKFDSDHPADSEKA